MPSGTSAKALAGDNKLRRFAVPDFGGLLAASAAAPRELLEVTVKIETPSIKDSEVGCSFKGPLARSKYDAEAVADLNSGHSQAAKPNTTDCKLQLKVASATQEELWLHPALLPAAGNLATSRFPNL